MSTFRSSKGTVDSWGPKPIIRHSIGAGPGETHLRPVVGFRNEHGLRVAASKGGSPENRTPVGR